MKSVYIVSLFLVCLFSCDKKDDCKAGAIAIKNFETDYGCKNTKYSLQINLNDDITVVRSKESYDSVVSGNCHPDIDFSLYDLVIGILPLSNSNDTITYYLSRTCPGLKLDLSIKLIQLSDNKPSTIVYHAIIPKLQDSEYLNIQLTYLYK
jgi:hypothetical protein